MTRTIDNNKDIQFNEAKSRYEAAVARIYSNDRTLGHLEFIYAKNAYDIELRLKKARDKRRDKAASKLPTTLGTTNA